MTEPQIFAGRQVYTSLAGKHFGEALKYEADRLKANLMAEVARRLPEHEIDEHAFRLEIGLKYYVRGDEAES